MSQKVFLKRSVYCTQSSTLRGHTKLKAELNRTFAKLMNPRMNAGLVMLHTLLAPLKGTPIEPGEVREAVDDIVKEREVSKQSITNVARRLEESSIIERTKGYSVNYGYLISMLLHNMMQMTKRMNDLEEEILSLKELLSPPA